MTGSIGKRPALLSAGLGLAVLGAAAVVERDALVERYWILRLGSADEKIRRSATEKLAEMKSVAAVPRRIELLRDDPLGTVQGVLIAGKEHDAFHGTMGPVSYALYRIGMPALPAIEKVLGDLEAERLMFHGALLNPDDERKRDWSDRLRGIQFALSSPESQVDLLDFDDGE